MNRVIQPLIAAAVAAPLLAAAPVGADETLSADEIFRRLEIQAESLDRQQPGTATRGMKFDYGQSSDSTAAVPETGSSATVTESLPETQQTAIPLSTYQTLETTVAAPVDDPTELFYQQPDATAPGTPGYVETATTAARPVERAALQEYNSVVDEARIDLRIYFEWNSAALRSDAIGQLGELCTAIRRVAGQRVFKIIGHTDKSGSAEYNLYLSEARAREVKRHLVEECGVPESALLAIGEGERQADPASPAVSPDERLVEFQLVG